MKKTICFLALLHTLTTGFSQNYFSGTIPSNTYINTGGMCTFNNKNLVIATEFCDGFVAPNCGYILEIGNTGAISYLHDLGSIFLFDKSFTANTERLAIAGRKENDELSISQFDKNLLEVQHQNYAVTGKLWIFDMIEYAGHYVVAAYNYGNATNENYPSLYWVDTTDLSLDYTYIFPQDQSTFQELSIDGNNNLRVLNQRNNGPYVLSFNSDMQLLSEWKTPEAASISYLNAEIIQGNQLVIGLASNRYLKCYSPEGILNWEKNVAAAFGISEIKYIRQLKTVENDDILLCGTLTKYGQELGFIYKIGSDGTEKWKRLFKVVGSSSNVIKDFTMLPNEEYLFYGTADLEYLPNISNAHDAYWTLKTNADGCIGSYCGIEIVLASKEADFSRLEIYPNPVVDQLFLEGIADGQPVRYRLTDIAGKTLLQGSTSISIDMQSVNPGTYFLQVFSEESGFFTRKIIKCK